MALIRAGRRSEFEQVRADLAGRYADETVTIGGQKATAGELLKAPHRRRPELGSGEPSTPAADAGPDLAGSVNVAWQLRFAESIEAGMSPPELTQWESNSISVAVPAVTIDGSTLYANYLGHIFALDLKSGKLLWRLRVLP